MDTIRERIRAAFSGGDLSTPPDEGAGPLDRLPWLLGQTTQGDADARRELTALLGFHCAVPVGTDERAAWVATLSLEACHVIESVWDATDDLDACPVVRQARVWRELHDAPADAAEWWAIVTDHQGGRARLAETIGPAFEGVAPSEGISLWDAQAISNHGNDERPGHDGRWQDVPRRDLMLCEEAIPSLDDAGKRFYVPAMMNLVLRFPLEWVDGFAVANPGWLWLDLAWTSLEPHTFEPQQRVVVDRFFRAMGFEGDAFDAWRSRA